jgi:hypothetical protein
LEIKSLGQIRNKIFISHAAPEDNEFTRWLSLQLIGLGYHVWSDVIRLKGGEDFWIEIENEIRNNTVKFLYVLSSVSNQREGTLKELAVAQKVKKHLQPQAPHFIIPLHIDSNLSYDEINIDLVRLNSINFKSSWHIGLLKLLEKLEEDNIPKSAQENFELVNNLWQNIYLNGRSSIQSEELYSSNWFPITELPQTLYFHKFSPLLPNNFRMWRCKYPAYKYKDCFATFAGHYNFMEEIPKTQTYNPQNSLEVDVASILIGEYDTNFISNNEARNIITNLVNLSFKHFFKISGLRVYKLASKRIAYWFPIGSLEKDKSNGVLMVGKMKYGKDNRINWHFAISSNARNLPELVFAIKSHIVFTWDGKTLIDKDSIQHRGRRKQGKNWWNKHWREKLLNFLAFFSDDEKNIVIPVGEEQTLKFSVLPVMFSSPVTYNDPSDDNLPEDDEIETADEDETLETEKEHE